ncbi:MAG: nuclear transport factor 2 family protein [Deltaproteobacteria bacterium]|nr:nuclear transport factor 2 family protein [Deltaproteobacteria bacterium]
MKELLQRYFSAFEKKDIATLRHLFTEEVTLEDPFVKKVKGHAAVLACYRDIFEKSERLHFHRLDMVEARDNMAFCEFDLEMKPHHAPSVRIVGVDIFRFEGEKICELRAYLDTHGLR